MLSPASVAAEPPKFAATTSAAVTSFSLAYAPAPLAVSAPTVQVSSAGVNGRSWRTAYYVNDTGFACTETFMASTPTYGSILGAPLTDFSFFLPEFSALAASVVVTLKRAWPWNEHPTI